MRALVITIADAILGPSRAQACGIAILLHGDEIQSPFQPAIHQAVIDGECDLTILHPEHLVLVVITGVQHVHTRTNVGRVWIFGHEPELQRVIDVQRGGTVGFVVLLAGAFTRAIGSASFRIWASGGSRSFPMH